MYIPPVPGGKTIPLLLLKTKAQQALNKKVPLLDIEIFNDQRRTVIFRYRERNNDASLYTNYFISYDRVYMNPYTGEAVKVENSKWEFFNLVVMMHCTLLLGYWGKQVITWSTIIFIIMLISGLILWWPRNVAAANKRFRFSWKNNSNWKRKNYDLHQIPGFYISVISIFLALSGLSMILPKLDTAIQYVVNGGSDKTGNKMLYTNHMAGSKIAVADQTGVLDQMMSASRTAHPEAASYRIFTPKSTAEPIVVKNFKDEATHYAYTQTSFDQASAKPAAQVNFASLSNGEKVHELTYDIHVGAILGLPGKILAFMASFIAASLPVSGFLIWRGRKKQHIHNEKNSGLKTC